MTQITPLSDEELLKDAEECWKNAFKLKGDPVGIQAMTLVSMSASLLVIARNSKPKVEHHFNYEIKEHEE